MVTRRGPASRERHTGTSHFAHVEHNFVLVAGTAESYGTMNQ
jgi:hypothetical protein